jgi:streptogrisin C
VGLLIRALPAAAQVPDHIEIESYTRLFDVEPKEAEEHLAIQAQGSQVVDALRRSLGKQFAGVWFDNAKGEFVVPLAPEANASAVQSWFTATKLQGSYRTEPARSTLAELEAAETRLIEALQSKSAEQAIPMARAQIGIDTASNSVVVDIPADEGAVVKAAVKGQVTSERSVDVVLRELAPSQFDVSPAACSFPYCGRPLRGGVEIQTSPGESPSACTAGFKAIGNSFGNRFIMTAGHCGEVGSNWRSFDQGGANHYIGAVEAKVLGSGGDGAVIKANGSWWDEGAWPSELAMWEVNLDSPIYASAFSVPGELVCHEGQTSGTSCGYVGKTNVKVTYSSGVSVYHLSEVGGVCGYEGDSGGPVFNTNTAHGIFDAVSKLNSCGTTAYFSEVENLAPSFGVHIATG